MAWSVKLALRSSNSDQGGVAALPLVAGEMLSRSPPGFTGKLRETGLMHAMPAGGIDADRPDMVHALDQAKHRAPALSLGAIWRSQTSQALPACRPALCQRIQLAPLLARQTDGQPALDLLVAPESGDRSEAFEAPGRWDDDPAPPAFLMTSSAR